MGSRCRAAVDRAGARRDCRRRSGLAVPMGSAKAFATVILPSPTPPLGAEKFGAWWDEEAAQRACDFFPTYLRHIEGEWAGRPFVLPTWQRDRLIRPIFGWKRADGSRLIRLVWFEVPRKNGKTSISAGLALLLLFIDNEIGGQGYSMAVDKPQASLVFDKAGQMAGMNEGLRRRLELLKTSIYCPALLASFKPLSAGPKGKHGFSPSFAIGDEVHEWSSGAAKLADVVHKGTAARRQPLEIYITTAGVKDTSYAAEMHEWAEQVARGELVDPTMLVVIFAAPEGADWRDEATWRAANPNYGISVKPEYMRAECEKAKRSPRAENEFKRYHLNIWTEQTTRWLPMEAWRLCTTTPDDANRWKFLAEELAGEECYGGLDLSVTRDFTSLALAFPPSPARGRDRWTFLWWNWLPEQTVEDATLARRSQFRSFADVGALSITSGNVVDYGFVRREILAIRDRYNLRWLGVDRFNAVQLVVQLKEEDGVPVELFGQGYVSMNAPSKEFERMIVSNQVEHGNNPVATWMARNALVTEDPAGNIKPDKARAADKIDDIVAAIMALGGAIPGTNRAKPSIYETRGLLSF